MSVRSISTIGGTQASAAQPQGMTLLASTIVTAATGITFDNIPSGYKHLMFVWHDMHHSTTGAGNLTINNSTTTTQYQHQWRVVATTVVTASGRSSASAGFQGSGNSSAPFPATASGDDAWSHGVMWIYRYTESDWKFVKIDTTGDTGHVWMFGRWKSTSPVTRFDIVRTGSQTMQGKFYLYGVN